MQPGRTTKSTLIIVAAFVVAGLAQLSLLLMDRLHDSIQRNLHLASGVLFLLAAAVIYRAQRKGKSGSNG